MEEREIDKMQREEDMMSLLIQQLDEYREEVRLAIETASNAPYKLMSAVEVCKALNISFSTLQRYERSFNIPVRKVGNKKFYFEAEVKNCIITGLRLWKQ